LEGAVLCCHRGEDGGDGEEGGEDVHVEQFHRKQGQLTRKREKEEESNSESARGRLSTKRNNTYLSKQPVNPG
jgi:hypothetical protein